MSAGPAFERWRALGTEVVVGAADPAALAAATDAVRLEIEACDRACSRFRDDSELTRLNTDGRLHPASAWLCEAVGTAVQAARSTGGLVDPTIGQSLIDLGYDRTFEDLQPDTPVVVRATHVPAWHQVRVDASTGRLSVPAGVRLDLGATAKALCADRGAARAAREVGGGVLVSLGGDIAVAGMSPAGDWRVRVTERADHHPAGSEPGQTVTVRTGGVATSGTAARRWARAGAVVHHLIDPRTGQPAAERWRTVTVAAPSCTAANTASTAAVVLGDDAVAWLEARGHDARLVGPSGEVAYVGAWPTEPMEVPA